MTAKNKKHVWARKFGDTLELKFIFRSVARDGALIHNVLHQDLPIKRSEVESVDKNTLRDIADTLESSFAKHMQRANDLWVSKMTAKTLKRLNETGDVKKTSYPLTISSQAMLMDIGQKIRVDKEAFTKKYSNILEKTDLPVHLKLRLKKGPAPR